MRLVQKSQVPDGMLRELTPLKPQMALRRPSRPRRPQNRATETCGVRLSGNICNVTPMTIAARLPVGLSTRPSLNAHRRQNLQRRMRNLKALSLAFNWHVAVKLIQGVHADDCRHNYRPHTEDYGSGHVWRTQTWQMRDPLKARNVRMRTLVSPTRDTAV